MTVIALPNDTLARIGDEVAKSMAHALQTPGGMFIVTPLCYPSGTSVLVRIEGSKHKYFVSDTGMGHQESMMLNASNSYSSIARNIATNTGVSFDSRSFFVAEADEDDLVHVVGAVANFSQRAVIETAIKHEAQKLDRDRAALLMRLSDAFRGQQIEKDVEVIGASNIEWEVTARVSNSRSVTLFDYAKPHKNSVTSTVAKFHDIARLQEAPRRVVTINNSPQMEPFKGLLSQSASVIDLAEVPNEVLLRLAA